MDIVFVISNSKQFDPRRRLLNLKDKINLKKSDIYAALSNLSICNTWKIIKSNLKAINSKYQLQRDLINLSYLKNHFLCQIFKIILRISLKNMKQWLIIFPKRIYVNEKYIRILIKINTRYYLKHGMPETMTLLGSTKIR